MHAFVVDITKVRQVPFEVCGHALQLPEIIKFEFLVALEFSPVNVNNEFHNSGRLRSLLDIFNFKIFYYTRQKAFASFLCATK